MCLFYHKLLATEWDNYNKLTNKLNLGFHPMLLWQYDHYCDSSTIEHLLMQMHEPTKLNPEHTCIPSISTSDHDLDESEAKIKFLLKLRRLARQKHRLSQRKKKPRPN